MENRQILSVDDRVLGIAEMAEKYKCSLRTLRFYEDMGLLAPVRVGLHRFYNEKDEIKLQLVLKGKRLGLSLREVQALILARNGEAVFEQAHSGSVALLLPPRKIASQLASLTQRRAGIDAAIAELKEAQAARPIASRAV